jgi:hyperosmotically inducible protein
MKTPRLLTLALFASLPLALSAKPTTDRRIENTAKSSYTLSEVLDNKVEVKARDGVVTLTGKVADEAQKRLAEDAVAGLDGVTRVDNQIRVESAAREGSDEWLALKIRGMLLGKANVSLKHTDVAVKSGVVSLTGTAESTAQKELTAAYVKEIDGVKSVQNELQVIDRAKADVAIDPARGNREANKSARVQTDRETVGEKIDDGSITAQIKYELFSRRSTSAIKTKVNTINGHVIISGEAGSDTEKDLVTKLAKSVRGVVEVDNKMTVKK